MKNKKAQLKTKKSEIFSFQLAKKSKGQLKIQQMAFMLIAVTLFFVLVGLFVLVFKLSSLKQLATELQERNAMTLVTKFANSPEFSCGESFGTSKINCIDADKIMMLKQNIEEYKELWGISNIEIRKIYPKSEKDILCNQNNYPNCNIIRLIDENIKGVDLMNFVALCRKEYSEEETYDKCELAKLMISYEEIKL
jgi:hypothetical protein